jgi:uncharacterized membrane protein
MGYLHFPSTCAIYYELNVISKRYLEGLMLTANRDLMQQAREALKGRWGLAVVGNLIYLALMSVGQFIPIVGHFSSLIIGGPLLLGVTYFFLALSRKQEAAFSQIFDGLQRFVDALITYLLMALFIFLWSLLLIIPGIMAGLSYALTFYLMAENPGLKGKEALQRSKALMAGNRWKLFCLVLRFFGWFLLGVLTMGIGFLWIIPYLQTTMARFYDDLLGNSGSVSQPGTRAGSPVPPPPPQRPSEPAKAPQPAKAAMPPAEPPKPAHHPRAPLCLSCHTPIPDPEAKFCPACGFPIMEIPAPPRTPSAAEQTPKPATSPAAPSPVLPPFPKEIPPPSSAPRPLDLEATMMVGPPQLISLSPEGQKEIYDLRLPLIKIGRAGDNHLAFPQDRTISGHHCEIYREGKNFFIRDLGSTNGVFVNSRKVDSAPLTEGDEIKLGGKVFSFTRSG